ncbi:hypothetical protein ACFFKC_16390 [Pseudoduganella danionis]|uniref:DUF3077 domain-containing protein n=1 Tax=Pseudoduganella danionis TaxID=1890295 RepID=A0ABW9SPB2_9BURK|nr:hypothetical protein [Pseudoduganella danionis]MTW33470.1 hypothetical protein [Pseudoduganella danionis]
MSAFINQPALLKNLAGAHLPPVALNVSAEFQFCVDAGACAAACFFDDMTAVGLHDHVAISIHGFLQSLENAIVTDTAANGLWLRERKQLCVDAFGAGYLGRIHQELRLFHDVQTRRSGLFN